MSEKFTPQMNTDEFEPEPMGVFANGQVERYKALQIDWTVIHLNQGEGLTLIRTPETPGIQKIIAMVNDAYHCLGIITRSAHSHRVVSHDLHAIGHLHGTEDVDLTIAYGLGIRGDGIDDKFAHTAKPQSFVFNWLRNELRNLRKIQESTE